MIVKLSDLEKAGACKDQVTLFEHYFGAKLRLTRKICLRHAGDFDFDWAAQNLLPAPAWRAYDEAVAPALEAYKEAVAPALEAYKEAVAPAQKAYDEAMAPAWRAYDEAVAPARKAYDEATAPARKASNEARAIAFYNAATRKDGENCSMCHIKRRG